MPKWTRKPAPKDCNYGNGWCRELDRCWCQGHKYIVMSRKISTEWGIVEHVTLRTADNSDIPWAKKQQIKNELFGRNATAIEVFPRADRLVDAGVGQYHLWILPDWFKLPFGLHKDDTPTEAIER